MNGRTLVCKEENCGDSIEVDEQEVKAAVTKSYYPIHVLVSPLLLLPFVLFILLSW